MFSSCTKAMVVLISRSPLDFSRRSKGRQLRHLERARLAAALRQVTTERSAALAHVLHFRRVLARMLERHLGQLCRPDRDVEAVAERAHGVIVQLLGLVGRIERLARRRPCRNP
jgi:hypothetical protein